MDRGRLLIVFSAVLIVVAVSYYFGYVRNESVCLRGVMSELDSDMDTLDRWIDNPPDYVSSSTSELMRDRVRVSEYRIAATSIHLDPHRSICDYYVYGMALRRK